MQYHHGKMWHSKATGRSAMRDGMESSGFPEAVHNDQFHSDLHSIQTNTGRNTFPDVFPFSAEPAILSDLLCSTIPLPAPDSISFGCGCDYISFTNIVALLLKIKPTKYWDRVYADLHDKAEGKPSSPIIFAETMTPVAQTGEHPCITSTGRCGTRKPPEDARLGRNEDWRVRVSLKPSATIKFFLYIGFMKMRNCTIRLKGHPALR